MRNFYRPLLAVRVITHALIACYEEIRLLKDTDTPVLRFTVSHFQLRRGLIWDPSGITWDYLETLDEVEHKINTTSVINVT